MRQHMHWISLIAFFLPLRSLATDLISNLDNSCLTIDDLKAAIHTHSTYRRTFCQSLLCCTRYNEDTEIRLSGAAFRIDMARDIHNRAFPDFRHTARLDEDSILDLGDLIFNVFDKHLNRLDPSQALMLYLIDPDQFSCKTKNLSPKVSFYAKKLQELIHAQPEILAMRLKNKEVITWFRAVESLFPILVASLPENSFTNPKVAMELNNTLKTLKHPKCTIDIDELRDIVNFSSWKMRKLRPLKHFRRKNNNQRH